MLGVGNLTIQQFINYRYFFVKKRWRRLNVELAIALAIWYNNTVNENLYASKRRYEIMNSILIKDTTREERIRIVHQALWGACGIDCEFCSGCDNRGGGRTESIYQPYIDGIKEIREINEEFRAPFVRG